jgi:hypothetical protein
MTAMDAKQLNVSTVNETTVSSSFLSKCLESRKKCIGHNMYVSFFSTMFVRNIIRPHIQGLGKIMETLRT